MATTRAEIDSFLKEKRLAIVGVSRSGEGFGLTVMRALTEKGYEVVPINPLAPVIAGRACAASLAALPFSVGGVIVVVPPSEAVGVLEQAANAGIRKAWLAQGSSSGEALRACEAHGISVIHDECILMFVEPVQGIHRLHRWFRKIFGTLPAEAAKV